MALVAAAAIFAISACGDSEGRGDGPGPDDWQQAGTNRESAPTPDPRVEGSNLYGIWPQVWSQHAPGVKSWEYKVNCRPAASHTETCFLSDLTAVKVHAPNGSVTDLQFDFNTNEYSGEVTRRWVKYGPPEGSLPVRGDYTFRYWRGDELAFEQVVPYSSDPISYPTDVTWQRDGADLVVNWSPPAEATKDMHYKTIIWETGDTPDTFVSDVSGWDASSAVLKDVPLLEDGSYSLNVAIYFDDGYAYSEYVLFDWPAE